MPSLADWSRADIIASLALSVSILAFIASAVSSVVSWRSFLAGQASRTPKLRVNFEPFFDSDEWWIANFSIRNRSDNILRFERIKVVSPPGVVLSTYLGGYSGGASGGGPMLYDLPAEVKTSATAKELSQIDEDGVDWEYPPTGEDTHITALIVKMPRWRLGRRVFFRIDMLQLGELPVRKSFKMAALFPNKENTKPGF